MEDTLLAIDVYLKYDLHKDEDKRWVEKEMHGGFLYPRTRLVSVCVWEGDGMMR